MSPGIGYGIAGLMALGGVVRLATHHPKSALVLIAVALVVALATWAFTPVPQTSNNTRHY